MSSKYAAATRRDWVPNAISFIWRGQWMESAVCPAEPCIATALKAIHPTTGHKFLNAYPRDPDFRSSRDDALWTRYVVRSSLPNGGDGENVGELLIPKTPSNTAIDQAANLHEALVTEEPTEDWNYFSVGDEGSLRLEVCYGAHSHVYGPDGYPVP